MEAGAELVARARLICGEQHVLTNATVLATYRYDGIRRNAPLPLAAILPGSASEVAGVVSACCAAGVRYIVRGAGTSTTGDSLPVADGVLIVLSRMRRIIGSDPTELTVEAGAPLSSLPRPPGRRWITTDQTIGTVGGHVAETASVANIVALELVRPDGAHLHLDDAFPGYDVIGAFPGSRGRAGIAVAVTLRAVPET